MNNSRRSFLRMLGFGAVAVPAAAAVVASVPPVTTDRHVVYWSDPTIDMHNCVYAQCGCHSHAFTRALITDPSHTHTFTNHLPRPNAVITENGCNVFSCQPCGNA